MMPVAKSVNYAEKKILFVVLNEEKCLRKTTKNQEGTKNGSRNRK